MNSGCHLSERPRKGRRYSVWLFLRGLFATRKPPFILGGTLAMKRSCTDFEKNSTVTGGALPRPTKQREAAFCCQCLINAASSDALSALNFSRDVELFSILFRGRSFGGGIRGSPAPLPTETNSMVPAQACWSSAALDSRGRMHSDFRWRRKRRFHQ